MKAIETTHSRKTLATLLSASLAWFALPSHSLAVTVRTNFTTAGTFIWTCPDGITNIQVECWGGGGASGGGYKRSGGTGSGNNAGGGSGGGGAYAKVANVPVTPGTNYTVTLPEAAVAPSTWENGDPSPAGAAVTFTGDNGVTCTAAGGQGGINVVSTGTVVDGAGGAGGATADCVGDIAYAGGNGASAYGNGNCSGGGGGAGDSGAGGDAPGGVTTAGIGGTGAIQAGGAGGTGRTASGIGNPGHAPGGGAGGGKGAGSGSYGAYSGGNGALGMIALTYGSPTYKANNTLGLTDSGSWTEGVPGASDVAHWNNIVTSANTVSLGADTLWAGISIQDPGGLVTINAGNTLTLTSTGIGTAIDMTSATADLALDCDLVLGAASAWSVTSGQTLTVAGAISGGYGLNINGSGAGGTVALNGANTAYSGNTTLGGGTLSLGNTNAGGYGQLIINGGTLQLTDPEALGSSSGLSLASGTTLQLRHNAAATFNTPAWSLPYSSVANQTFTIDVDNNGSGSGNTLTLSGGINNYPVNTASMNKTLNITGAGGYSLSIPTLNSWGLNGSARFTLNPTTANVNIGAVSVNTAGDGQQCNLVFGTASSGSTSNSINSIAETSGNTHQLVLQFSGGTWAVGNINLNQGNGSQVNGGTLILNGTVTFGTSSTRTFTLNSGTLDWNNPGAFQQVGTATARVVLNGGYLDNTSGKAITTSLYDPKMAWNSSFTFLGSNGTNSDLYLGAGDITLGGNPIVSIQDPATTLTAGGVISGAYGLTKDGPGRLTLLGANTYTGDTTVNAGTLEIAQATLSANSTVALAGGAVLQLDFAGGNTVSNLVLNGVVQPAGVYDSTTGAPYITGSGSLVVPAVPVPVLDPSTGFTLVAGTSASFTFSTVPGYKYRLVTSDDLSAPMSSWTGVVIYTPVVSDGDGWVVAMDTTMTLIDLTSQAGAQHRFYRIEASR